MIPKFRAWSKSRKRFELIQQLVWHRDELTRVITSFKCVIHTNLPEDVILMQSTGLFDKNGVEIFEGDVVDFEDAYDIETVYVNRGIIKWCQGGFFVEGANSATMDDLLDGESLEVEVIGNIWENVDLIDNKKS